MKVVFVASFLNNHLLPFCLELEKRAEFSFVATEDWKDTSFNRGAIKKDFVINYFEEQYKDECARRVLEADVAIFGGSSEELLRIRKEAGKLSFVYTERFFKKGAWRRFIPSTARILREKFIENSDNLYVLCSGSFVARDLKVIGFDTSKCFRFGYFPLLEQKDIQELLQKKNNEIPKLLYVGRLLKLKRVDDVIKCCRLLRKEKIAFELDIVGDGPERRKLEKLCLRYRLDNVRFLGAKAPHEVAQIMAESNALFFSSNRHEGWGAVVNEAMSNACPVIESDACGSTAYLIRDGENGYTYRCGNVNALFDKTRMLLSRINDRDIYMKAYNTVKDEWNAAVAAERFINICEEMTQNKPITKYNMGPMSIEDM